MTASKTPRLGLMSPVGSDAFVTQDFATTFAALDANPGVAVVANAAARPTSYTAAQNGSLVYQADLNIVWVWSQPSSSQVGQWVRVGNTGLLAGFGNGGSVSTSTTNYANGPTVMSGSLTVPGGRPLLILLAWGQLDNYYGRSVVSYWENNVRIQDIPHYGYQGDLTGDVTWIQRPAVSSSLALTVKVTVAAYNAAPPNGGATSTMGNSGITIWEL
jgi:hypothetical protein